MNEVSKQLLYAIEDLKIRIRKEQSDLSKLKKQFCDLEAEFTIGQIIIWFQSQGHTKKGRVIDIDLYNGIVYTVLPITKEGVEMSKVNYVKRRHCPQLFEDDMDI